MHVRRWLKAYSQTECILLLLPVLLLRSFIIIIIIIIKCLSSHNITFRKLLTSVGGGYIIIARVLELGRIALT